MARPVSGDRINSAAKNLLAVTCRYQYHVNMKREAEAECGPEETNAAVFEYLESPHKNYDRQSYSPSSRGAIDTFKSYSVYIFSH